MTIKVVVHEAEEGGFWAEVPAIPGCASQGETMDELLRNVHEAIEGCLSVDVAEPKPDDKRPRSGNRRMKALSGRDFARLVERRGWAIAAGQRQPSYLWQDRKRGADLYSDPWKSFT